MRVLDLFSGCGGLSYGVSLAGDGDYCFDVIGGLDSHGPSIETFAANHPKAEILQTDIRKTDIADVLRSLGEIDLLIGGPSCQGFSTHGNRVADDPRNFLYRYFMDFVAKSRPTWVLMENVTGLLRYNRGAFRDSIIEDFRRLGYVVSFAQLQAADYGVPQVRKRVFFVANRLGIPFFFPRPIYGAPDHSGPLDTELGLKLHTYVTVADAIGDLPTIGLGCDAASAPTDYACRPFSPYQSWIRKNSKKLTLHFGTPAPAENYARIVNIPSGGDWLDIPECLMPERFEKVLPKDCTTLYYRLVWDRPSYTITTVYRNVSSGAFTHPDEDRALTHREAARLQSFPDSFQFNPVSISRQIGNAVPPLLAFVLGRAIMVHDKHASNKRAFIDIKAFEEEVRAEMETEVVPVSRRRVVKPPCIDVLKQAASPLSDKAWEILASKLEKVPVTVGSQVDLRGVLNGLIYCANNGSNTLTIPDSFAAPSTIIRLVNDWVAAGIYLDVVQAAVNSYKRNPDGQVTKTGGEPRPTKRRRLRPYSKHHFATVLYPIDTSTYCTIVE